MASHARLQFHGVLSVAAAMALLGTVIFTGLIAGVLHDTTSRATVLHNQNPFVTFEALWDPNEPSFRGLQACWTLETDPTPAIVEVSCAPEARPSFLVTTHVGNIQQITYSGEMWNAADLINRWGLPELVRGGHGQLSLRWDNDQFGGWLYWGPAHEPPPAVVMNLLCYQTPGRLEMVRSDRTVTSSQGSVVQ